MNDINFKKCQIVDEAKINGNRVVIPCMAEIPCENGGICRMPLKVYTSLEIYSGEKFKQTVNIAKGFLDFGGAAILDGTCVMLNLVSETRIKPGYETKVAVNSIDFCVGGQQFPFYCNPNTAEVVGYCKATDGSEYRSVIINHKNSAPIMVKPGCFYNAAGVLKMRGAKFVIYSDIFVRDSILNNETIRIVM